MDDRVERQSLAVNRVPLIYIEIEIERVAEAVISLVDRGVGSGRLTLRPNELSRLGLLIARGVNCAMYLGGRTGDHLTGCCSQKLHCHPLHAVRGIQGQSVQCRVSLGGVSVPRHLSKDMRRQDAENGM